MWERKDHVKSPSLSLKRWKQLTNLKRRFLRHFLFEKLKDVDLRDKQKIRNTNPRMRSVAEKIIAAQLQDWHILISQFAAHWLLLRKLHFYGKLFRVLSFIYLFILENSDKVEVLTFCLSLKLNTTITVTVKHDAIVRF